MTEAESGGPGFDQLYLRPVTSSRSGPLYNAFSYPTKIDPEAIALFLASHTAPNDMVLDVFAGSGTTGIAAKLCESPTLKMQERARDLGLPVKWGPRSVTLYELSVVGALLAQIMSDPPDPEAFERSARRIVHRASDQLPWLYEGMDGDHGTGRLRHMIWTDVLVCDSCRASSSFWDLAVAREPLRIRRVGTCPECGAHIKLDTAERLTESGSDPILDEPLVGRLRRPVFAYGRTGSHTWKRPVQRSDLEVLERVEATAIPPGVPTQQVFWGDLYRSGYHQGISRVHHFYTRRNLIALGTLWNAIDDEPSDLRPALRLLVLSYNASHSTLMTRVVVKRGLSDFVVSGAQSGVLYVSSLPLEKNVFEGVARKIGTFRRAFDITHGGQSTVRVVNGSSTTLDLPDNSVDYVFTDPPFGDFIPYAEINQINEAWLGGMTQRSDEAIISPAQGKAVSDYAALMKGVFAEVSRVMKPHALATVVFHSSKAEVWGALGDALRSAGLVTARTSLLDKTQVSFKQVVSEGGTRGDAVFLLRKGAIGHPSIASSEVKHVIARLRDLYGSTLNAQHMYTRYVAECLEDGRPVELGSNDFYEALREIDRQASGR